ncbi:glycosyltransferase [Stutzerimonas urumqiensis]|uniref:glycosyltransferase n=1 Tax=Stutzerimonas urumqiensis TaxID=638269 RepID=UPI003BA8ABB3
MTPFSIVTISWNNLEGLKQTYESLRAQTYRNFRWIVIDGASKDGTLDWLQSLNEANAEITCEPDKGIYDAMNKGLRQAVQTPGYTLFLNSGDSLADAGVLADVAAAIEGAAVAPKFVYGDFFRREPNGYMRHTTARPIERVRVGLPASHQTMYFENERLRGMSFRENYKLSADYCMLIEFLDGLDLGTAVICLQRPLCIFDATGVSNMRRFEAIKEDMQIRMRFLKYSAVKAFALYLAHYLHTHSKIVRAALNR